MSKFHFLSGIDAMMYNSQLTTYKGQTVTVAQKRALKAAETRKKNAEEKKKRKKDNMLHVDEVLPELLKQIEKTRKSVRNLKSICAFVDNGPVQWHRDYRELMMMYPNIEHALGCYHAAYNETLAVVEKLKAVIKKNKCDKAFFGIANDFGYKMQDLLDHVRKVSDEIGKSQVTQFSPFVGKEIIESSADGRRPGLKHIMRNTYSTISTTEQNIRELAIALQKAYNTVVNYSVNGKLI